MTAPRETNMDGILHIEGQCCEPGGSILGQACRRCGGRLHRQPVYGGIAYTCEQCPEDAHYWKPRGTYKVDEDCCGMCAK